MGEFTDRKLFQDFLGDGSVFIVDENTSSMRRLSQVLTDLGAKSTNIFRFTDLTQAQEKLKHSMPKMVLCDYNVGAYSGLDLFQTVREKDPQSSKSVFIVVTSNMDQAAVARAAEEDVDAYIVKPFSFSAIKETIQSSVVSKVRPSQYMQCIEQAKIMMEHRKFEECLSTLKRALKMNAKPTLAYYYLGLLKTKLSKTQEAKDSYRSGLKYNKIHFKCQKGLYETYMKEKKYVQAYDVIQTLSEYFPPNAERLSTAIRLAVLTQNFTDISRYYMAFKTLERRSEEAIGHVCAGLFVLGKYFIQEHNKPKAIESFEKLCATCSGNPKFLIPVIQSLLENMMFDYVESFFLKIDRDVVSTDDYELCQFYSSVNKSRDQDIVKNGLSLINKGIRDFWLYRLSIDAMIKSRFKEQAFEFIHKGKKLWPMKSNAWARLEYFAKKIEDQAAVPSSTKAA